MTWGEKGENTKEMTNIKQIKYSQKRLIFTEIIQSIEHLNNNEHGHGHSRGMSIIKYTARKSSLPCCTSVKIHLQSQISEFQKGNANGTQYWKQFSKKKLFLIIYISYSVS